MCDTERDTSAPHDSCDSRPSDDGDSRRSDDAGTEHGPPRARLDLCCGLRPERT
eukprot:gene6154-6205_t